MFLGIIFFKLCLKWYTKAFSRGQSNMWILYSFLLGFHRWPAGAPGPEHADGGGEGAGDPADCAVDFWPKWDL